MATLADQIAHFKVVTNLQSSESISDSTLETFYAQALSEFNVAYSSVDLLNVKEQGLVLKLSWIKLCHLRASRSLDGNLRTDRSGYGQDRDGPFEKNMKLAKLLREEFDDELENAGLGESGIRVTSLIRANEVTGTFTQHKLVTPLTPPTVSVTRLSPTEAVVAWLFDNVERFSAYVVFSDTISPVAQAWNATATNPGVSDTAVALFSTSSINQRSLKVTGLTPTVIYKFVVAVRDTNGSYSFSNEAELV